MASACLGFVTDQHNRLKIFRPDKKILIDLSMEELENAFNKTFGDMI